MDPLELQDAVEAVQSIELQTESMDYRLERIEGLLSRIIQLLEEDQEDQPDSGETNPE